MKTPLHLVLLTISIFFFSCQKDDQIDLIESSQNLDLEGLKVCTELHDESLSRAFGYTNNFWNKEVLTVKFLGGSDYVRSKVMQYANQWSQYADIRFQFVQSGNADIRISFDRNSGSWSYVGRSNQYIRQSEATMNFGWFTDRTSDAEFRRTTLHEFGHALGLLHEHQHPQSSIDWNLDALYAYYARTQDWSKSDVDDNIVSRYSASRTNYSAYDPRSIMHYSIPRSLVNGNWTEYRNSTLSETDRSFIQSVYPFEGDEDQDDGDGGDETVNTDCSCPSYSAVIACENFENHQSGSFTLGENWAKWDSNSGHGIVGGLNGGSALNIDYRASSNPDIIFKPATFSQGRKSIQWDLVVDRSSSAYFNIQKQATAGAEYGLECFFYANRTGRMSIGDQTIRFRYPQSSVLTVKLDMNFATDQMNVSINGQSIMNFPISQSNSSSTGTKQVSGINFYAADANADFWLDNFCVGDVGGSSIDAPVPIDGASITIDAHLENAPFQNIVK